MSYKVTKHDVIVWLQERFDEYCEAALQCMPAGDAEGYLENRELAQMTEEIIERVRDRL